MTSHNILRLFKSVYKSDGAILIKNTGNNDIMIVYFISDDLRNYSDDGEEYVRAYWKKCEDENDDGGKKRK